jgi:hypothetical protein
MHKKSDTLEICGPLAESMDQSIGEVTTVMGAMITELMRRSLRGGVLRIGEELQSLVVDKVDTTIAERVPEVERTAMAAAEQTAQIAAAKVAAEEVHALDEKHAETARRLESQIEEVGRESKGAVEERAQELVGRIAEAEKRVCEVTQTEFEQRLAGVIEKSRETAVAVKARLKALEEASEALNHQFRDERAARENDLQVGFARMQQALERLTKSVELSDTKLSDQLRDEVAAQRKTNEDLAARVAALEKPKGFFSRWFGKRKDKGEIEGESK